jgi:hypothetical protein
MPRFSPLLAFLILVGLIALLSLFGPREASLGANVRLVYLHGAWVWTALVGFGAAALAGLVGLLFRRPRLQAWSVALGQAGTFFWVTYLPLSLWTMQATWNGLFLDEPRWRIGLNLAVVAVLLQMAILALGRPSWGSVVNALFAAVVFWSVGTAEQVMHPPSPIASSGSLAIRGFFLALLAVSLLACWLLARWMLDRWLRRGRA